MAGHVFVVPGSLEALDCDDVVVPTDASVSVRSIWFPVLGWGDEETRKRELGGAGRLSDAHRCVRLPLSGGRRRWLLSVGSDDGDIAWLTRGLRQVLDQAAGHSPGKGRVRQRIALPTLGVSGGGFGSERGAVIRTLLSTADEMAIEHDVDVVFVAFDPADYSAFQSIRQERNRKLADPAHEAKADELAHLAREGKLALFMGAGTGISAGLPSWGGLLEALSGAVGLTYDQVRWNALSPLDAAELLRRAAADAMPTSAHPLGSLVVDQIGPVKHYALSHVQLAALGCEQVITTNFDRLYECAVDAIGAEQPIVVLPGTTGRELTRSAGGGWLLKLHGDVGSPDSIVLDRRSFVTFDARRRPLGGVLQATLLTKHLLVVGASMTDDNVIRLIHEVAELTEQQGKQPALGTVLALRADELRRRLWRPEFDYLDLGPESGDVLVAARALEIFLDRVTVLASEPRAHLLRDAYEALLPADERAVAADARSLHESVAPLTGAAWAALASALATFGAGPRRSARQSRSLKNGGTTNLTGSGHYDAADGVDEAEQSVLSPEQWANELVSCLKALPESMGRPRLSYLAATSKAELPVRDELAFLLHQRFDGASLRVCREWSASRRDLAVVDASGSPLVELEAKALYSFDLLGATADAYFDGMKSSHGLDVTKMKDSVGAGTPCFLLSLITHLDGAVPAASFDAVKYAVGHNAAVEKAGQAGLWNAVDGWAERLTRWGVVAHRADWQLGDVFGVPVRLVALLVGPLDHDSLVELEQEQSEV